MHQWDTLVYQNQKHIELVWIPPSEAEIYEDASDRALELYNNKPILTIASLVLP